MCVCVCVCVCVYVCVCHSIYNIKSHYTGYTIPVVSYTIPVVSLYHPNDVLYHPSSVPIPSQWCPYTIPVVSLYHPSSTQVLLVHFVCLVVSVVDSLTSESMDNKETERIMEEDVSSMKEKSDSPDEETSKEELPPKDMSEVCV